MAQVLTQAWKKTALGMKLATLNAGTVGLFVNNITPTFSTTYGALTQPADTGYVVAGLAPTFAAAGNFGTGDAQSVSPNVSWTFTYSGGVPFTIYGYFLADSAHNLLSTELAAASTIINAAGQTYTVAPVMTEGSY